jgi:hypothetical protein
MLITTINMDTYLSGKTLFTVQHFSLILRPFNNNSYLCFMYFIRVTTHIGPVEEIQTNFIFIEIRNIWLLIE